MKLVHHDQTWSRKRLKPPSDISIRPMVQPGNETTPKTTPKPTTTQAQLSKIHRCPKALKLSKTFNNPTKDYGFEVRVEVGGSINDLHPSSLLLKHLKREIDLNDLKTKEEKPHGHKSTYDGATYYKVIKVKKPSKTIINTNSPRINTNFLSSEHIPLSALQRSKDGIIGLDDI